MTAPEMEYEFKVVYESIASGNAPGYTSREISVLLTQAQRDIVLELAQKGPDMTDYERTILGGQLYGGGGTGGLFKRFNSVIAEDTGTTYQYGYITTMPADFFYPFIETIETDTTHNIPVKPVSHDAVASNLSNPFAKPYSGLFWRVFENNYLVFIGDGATTPTYVKGIYIKKPTPIITAILTTGTIDGLIAVTDCQLPEMVHRDIVYKAAKKAYAAVKDQAGYQLQNIEQGNN